MKYSEILSELRQWAEALQVTAVMLCIISLIGIFAYAGTVLYTSLIG